MIRFFAILSCFVFATSLNAAIIVNAGPEVFYMHRFREGGTWQNGRIDGIRVGVERFKRAYGWYLGADFLHASGRLKGKTATGRNLKSTLTDDIFEARLGFSFQNFVPGCPYFVPFGGWGWFRERNNFVLPSPIPVKFEDTFNYVVAGFLSGVNFTPLLTMGINFKVKFMLNGKSKVTNDPIFDDVELLMENEIQCRLDVPFTYSKYEPVFGLAIQFAPFYEFRHFGGREGFPFNFRDTKFHLWGARLAITYGF